MPENPIVILTREKEDNLILAEKLGYKKINSFSYPCIDIIYKKLSSYPPEVKAQFEKADLFIFSSKNGIKGFKFLFGDIIRKDQKIAVIGKSSSEEIKNNFNREPDLISGTPTGESLAHSIIKGYNTSNRLVYIRGDKTLGLINKLLTKAGFTIFNFEVYKNDSPILDSISCDPGLILFASPSAVKCFFKYNKQVSKEKGWKYLAIGPTTAEYLMDLNISEVFKASDPTVESIVKNIEEILKNQFDL